MTELDRAIALCEQAGLSIVHPKTPDEDLKAIYNQVYKLLRMGEDMVADGAKLVINHPSYLNPSADMVALSRSALVGKIDAILKGAVVEREQKDAA